MWRKLVHFIQKLSVGRRVASIQISISKAPNRRQLNETKKRKKEKQKWRSPVLCHCCNVNNVIIMMRDCRRGARNSYSVEHNAFIWTRPFYGLLLSTLIKWICVFLIHSNLWPRMSASPAMSECTRCAHCRPIAAPNRHKCTRTANWVL